MSTIAERQAKALEHVCPRCRQGVGNPCRSAKGRSGYTGPTLKAPHPERLAKLPFDLNWHRTPGKLMRALDTRTTPHSTVYEIGRDETRRDGRQWYLATWVSGSSHIAQRKEGLSTSAVAKRLASHSRCGSCGIFTMFADLEHVGHGLYQCRDRQPCEARVEAEQAQARAELLATRQENHDDIYLSKDEFGLPVLHLVKGGAMQSHSLTEADVRKLGNRADSWPHGTK
jgi:hypothetical protein